MGDLATLITGEITQATNDQMIQALNVINHQAILVSHLFENNEVISAEQAEFNKQKIKVALHIMAQTLKNIYRPSQTKMVHFDEQILQYLPSVVKLILGTNKTEISNAELPELINNLPQMAILAYESAQNKNIERSQKEEASALLTSMEILNANLKNSADHSAASIAELNKLVHIKGSHLSTYLESVKTSDLSSRVLLIRKIAKKALSFHRFYEAEKLVLESPSRSYKFQSLRMIFVDQKEAVEEFISIVNEKHFSKRTAEAVVEWGIINEIKAHLKSDVIANLLPKEHQTIKALVGDAISLEMLELSSRQTSAEILAEVEENKKMSAILLKVLNVDLQGKIEDNKLWTEQEVIDLVNAIVASDIAFNKADANGDQILSAEEIKSLTGVKQRSDELNARFPVQAREEAFKFLLEKGYLPEAQELVKYMVRSNRSIKIQKHQLLWLFSGLKN